MTSLLLYLDEVYEDAFPPDPDSGVKAIRDGFVERLFLIDRAASFQVTWMITRSWLRRMPR